MGSSCVATDTEDKAFPLHEVPTTAVLYSQPLRGVQLRSSLQGTHCFSERV